MAGKKKESALEKGGRETEEREGEPVKERRTDVDECDAAGNGRRLCKRQPIRSKCTANNRSFNPFD